MATNPNQGACLKCGTALVPGAGFCGSCGTPVGSAGAAPLPPPLPPRPLAHGGRQVALSMDQGHAMQAAMGGLTAAGGEVTNQGPTQIAFRLGSFLSGRTNGAIDAFQEGPGRTMLNVSLKPDYSSLVPALLIAVVMGVVLYILGQQGAYRAMTEIDPITFQRPSPGLFAFFTWWLILLLIVAGFGLWGWLLSGPMLEKRRATLMQALQMQAGGGQPLPGMGAPSPFPGAAPGMPAPAAPQATPVEQLKKLAELRDSGAISPADFETAKAAIIARMS